MIKFLGHAMTTIDEKMYFDDEYVCDISDIDYLDDEPAVFAPSEHGHSCLMTGPNKSNYGTFLEQEDFLKNVYSLMTEKNDT